MVGEITIAGQTQSTSIQEVNQAILQIDQVTQQNAALVEEAAAAAGALKEQSVKLIEMVSVFNIDVSLSQGTSRCMPEPWHSRCSPV
jgi:methyl-accepting chemotaxis protein